MKLCYVHSSLVRPSQLFLETSMHHIRFPGPSQTGVFSSMCQPTSQGRFPRLPLNRLLLIDTSLHLMIPSSLLHLALRTWLVAVSFILLLYPQLRQTFSEASSASLTVARPLKTAFEISNTYIPYPADYRPESFARMASHFHCHKDCQKSYPKVSSLKQHQKACPIWQNSILEAHRRRHETAVRKEEQRKEEHRIAAEKERHPVSESLVRNMLH